MFQLKSQTLEREFRVNNDSLVMSKIRNTVSGMDFIPDGNSTEFVIRYADGQTLSSKGLRVTDSGQDNDSLFFTFERQYGTAVTVTYWIGADQKTIKKQVFFNHDGSSIIDSVILENIGITNSKTHFTVPEMENAEILGCHTGLGQPFYIDSLFFGCEFPITSNGIFYGSGQVKYYIGKAIDGDYECPITVMGGASGNTMLEVQKAFFEYVDSISVKSDFRIQYNSWYDHMTDINADNIEKAFYETEKGLTAHGVPPLDSYVIDDGWNDYKASFWTFNKKFPNKLYDPSALAKKLGSELGLWLGPRGGYIHQKKFAKHIEKSSNGYFNAASGDICIASEKYINQLQKFLIDTTRDFDINYWKLDGFCLRPCTNEKHDHITGGKNDLYFLTEMWQRWIELFKQLRQSRTSQGKDLWINMTCYVNPSPWWLQYVNSVWLQNSSDLGFAENGDNQPQVEKEMTYRDSRYYDFLCTRALQFPTKNIYNHEPIYANTAKVDYNDEEFEKFVFFNACRGQAFNELYLSYNKLNEAKWTSLAKALNWQRNNYYILKNMFFLGGKPDENNIYAYVGWTAEGDGVIALRNPTDEKTTLTLTLNKLMGCPENLNGVRRFNVYNRTSPEVNDSYSYGDKIHTVLNPFEVKIFQFGKEDKRILSAAQATDFTISFQYNGQTDLDICENEDIKISIEKKYVKVKIGRCHLRSNSIISGNRHKITVVREKNKMIKIYIDKSLDSSGYDARANSEINTKLSSTCEDFKIVDKATPYNKIITLQKH